MAQGVRYVCDGCGKAIEAWSDGNPYYIDNNGAKQYAHHPDHARLARCIGNDSPHLCLDCGAEFMVDSLAPLLACPKCGSDDIVDSFKLGGHRCPYCTAGTFDIDPNSHCVS